MRAVPTRVDILDIEASGPDVVTRSVLDPLPRPPVAPAWLLPLGGGPLLFPLHKLVSLEENVASFRTFDEPVPERLPRMLQLQQWWTPQQFDIAQDQERHWEPAMFVGRSMVMLRKDHERGQGGRIRPLEPDEEIDTDRWVVVPHADHEHCLLCWKPFGGTGMAGYTEGGDWLCADCHRSFIEGDLLHLRE
jgi:hypothetical protein